eukprot:maker-scaffold_8-snap-gene-4.7-mRNA-1 protein AED:0.00 eAED:0.00 QI:28/0/0.5/1/0/0/2/1063/268
MFERNTVSNVSSYNANNQKHFCRIGNWVEEVFLRETKPLGDNSKQVENRCLDTFQRTISHGHKVRHVQSTSQYSFASPRISSNQLEGAREKYYRKEFEAKVRQEVRAKARAYNKQLEEKVNPRAWISTSKASFHMQLPEDSHHGANDCHACNEYPIFNKQVAFTASQKDVSKTHLEDLLAHPPHDTFNILSFRAGSFQDFTTKLSVKYNLSLHVLAQKVRGVYTLHKTRPDSDSFIKQKKYFDEIEMFLIKRLMKSRFKDDFLKLIFI